MNLTEFAVKNRAVSYFIAALIVTCPCAFGLAIPDIGPAIADISERLASSFHHYSACGGHDTGLEFRQAVVESLAALQLDDVEIVQWYEFMIDIDDRLVPVVIGWDMHVVESFKDHLGPDGSPGIRKVCLGWAKLARIQVWTP